MKNNNKIPETIEAIFIDSIEDLIKFIEQEDNEIQELIEQQKKSEKI